MAKNSEIKKISATYWGDDAVGVDLLEKSLRVDKVYRYKTEKDTAIVSLALSALKYSIEIYKKQNSVKYPTYENILDFLTKNEVEMIMPVSFLTDKKNATNESTK